jgi:hypothetical protein
MNHTCRRQWVPLKHHHSLPGHTVAPLWETQMSQNLHCSIFSILVGLLMACYRTAVPMVQNEICPVMSHSNHFNLPAALKIFIYKIHKAEVLTSIHTQFTMYQHYIQNWKPFICHCQIQRLALPHPLLTDCGQTAGMF